MNDNLLNAINLATIANWIMIIGVAVLIYVTRGSHHSSTSRKSLKK